MKNITIREARSDEARFIVGMIRLMVEDMANYGGHAAATDDTAWEKLLESLAAELQGPTAKFAIAERSNGDRIGVAGAELQALHGAFAPKKTLHISVVYVSPQFRGCGIGGKLVTTLLDWGRNEGIEECDLHVLNKNPAKSLYEKLGFSTVEVKMVRSL
jgi:ribosomal protein S18 acetylase RimI-like enzyme